jgi:hypothetical protein
VRPAVDEGIWAGKPSAAGSIAAHPCKERKDGAPSVRVVHTNTTIYQGPAAAQASNICQEH